ncbi:MAG TPA: alpha/beta hydrolase [Casimicrobiaceae bacterium]|nr:alpha/beta hydrolase [Casimicrobiaceae bacterium]
MRIRVGDHDVYAYTGSRLADRAAHNMVFVHGSANDHSVFALQSRYFAYHGRNVYAVDLPGHGNSAGQALRGVELLADWLIAFLDAAAVREAALIGHSLGSLAVLETAARHPDRVTRIALLGTAVPMTVSDHLLAAAAANDHVAFEMINSWSFSAKHLLGGNPWPGVWMAGNAMRLMERARPNVLHADLVACRDYANGLRAAVAVQCPSLMLLGAHDTMAPARGARELAATLRNVNVVTLDCGHSMMSEQPAPVLDALRQFLL